MLHHLLKTASVLLVASVVALIAGRSTVAQTVPKGTAKGAGKTAAPVARVDLNTASVAQLESLPGVGPAIAKAIVAGRPYKSTEELDRVRGIGKARIATLRPLVTVSGSPTTPVVNSPPAASATPAGT